MTALRPDGTAWARSWFDDDASVSIDLTDPSWTPLTTLPQPPVGTVVRAFAGRCHRLHGEVGGWHVEGTERSWRPWSQITDAPDLRIEWQPPTPKD